MPYLRPEWRKAIDADIDRLVFSVKRAFDDHVEWAGAVNYIVTRLSMRVTTEVLGGPKYYRFALMIGTLVCCVLELYRRGVAPYEDQKAAENGDIPEFKGDR